MPALNETGRKRLMLLIEGEVQILLAKARELSFQHWQEAEKTLMQREGMGDDLLKMSSIQDQIQALQEEYNALKEKHDWRKATPTPKHYQEAGFNVDDGFYPHPHRRQTPRLFDQPISTRWELEIFKILDEELQISTIQRVLQQVTHAVTREISLAGNYETARAAYMQFFTLIKKACGDDIPPLLQEIVDMPLLLPPGEDRPALGPPKEEA